MPTYKELKNKFINLCGQDNFEVDNDQQRKEREKKASTIVDNEALETEIE